MKQPIVFSLISSHYQPVEIYVLLKKIIFLFCWVSLKEVPVIIFNKAVNKCDLPEVVLELELIALVEIVPSEGRIL
jgi:hypothetical protein